MISFVRSLMPRGAISTLALSLGLILGGCSTFGKEDGPPNPAMSSWKVMTAAEIETHLRSGVTPQQILDAVWRRGAEPIRSEDVEMLRRAGASHELINGLLNVNTPVRLVYVYPPLFSYYRGYPGWYWVNSFGWPVYPQPHPGWYPRRRSVDTSSSTGAATGVPSSPAPSHSDAGISRMPIKPSPKPTEPPKKDEPSKGSTDSKGSTEKDRDTRDKDASKDKDGSKDKEMPREPKDRDAPKVPRT